MLMCTRRGQLPLQTKAESHGDEFAFQSHLLEALESPRTEVHEQDRRSGNA
jgi:hypothetical protein